MSTDNEIESDFLDKHEVMSSAWGPYLDEAELDLDYYFRAQHTPKEAELAKEQERDLETIDKIGRQVNLIVGYQIRNRHILKIAPQGQPDEVEDKACEQHSQIVMNLMELNGGYDMSTACFRWANMVTGSNLLEIWRNRDGDLQFSRLGYNQFLLDQGVSNLDLSDCDDIITGRWLTESNVRKLLPENADEITKITPLTFTDRWPKAGNPALGNQDGMRMYEEWWHRDTEFISMVVPRIDVPGVFKRGEELPLASFAQRLYQGDERLAKYKIGEIKTPRGDAAFSRYSKPVDRVKLRIFLDDELVWKGNNPLRSRGFNFVWYRGEYCAECPRSDLKLQSFTRRLRDPQKAFNRRYNQIMDIIESQIMSIRVIRDKYILNPAEAYKAGQGIVIHATDKMPDEMNLKELLYQGTGADVPPSLFQALETADRAETEASGLNNEIFGSDDKDIPAMLSRHRTGQALTGQMPMFDIFNGSNVIFGRKIVELVQLNYPPEKVFRLINEYPAQGFYKQDFIRYDCALVEGLLTSSQQELFWMELKELRKDFEDGAQLLPLSVIAKYCPTAFKSSLINIIRQGEQRMAQQAQAAQADEKRAQAMQEALTQDKRAEAQESRSQAMENRTGAALDRVNTAAKIQDMKTKAPIAIAKLMQEGQKLEIMKQARTERKPVASK